MHDYYPNPNPAPCIHMSFPIFLMLSSEYCCVPPTHLQDVPLAFPDNSFLSFHLSFSYLLAWVETWVHHKYNTLPVVFLYGFLEMSTGPGAARDQHFCASVMPLLHSYIPPRSLKYTCVIRSSVSPPSGYQLKVFISSSLPLKNLDHIHHLLFHSCCWHQFRQCYNHVTQGRFSSGFGPLPKSASISN